MALSVIDGNGSKQLLANAGDNVNVYGATSNGVITTANTNATDVFQFVGAANIVIRIRRIELFAASIVAGTTLAAASTLCRLIRRTAAGSGGTWTPLANANWQEVGEQAFDGDGSYNFATAVSGSAAADTRAGLPAPGTATYFSGAIGGAPVTSGYAAALNVALTIPGWTVFCDANTQAVQALLTQHVETASSVPYGMWRRGFTGSAIGDSVAATQLNAQQLDSLQMNYLYPGIYATNTQTGKTQLYPGLYAAAAAAAIATGNQIALPLTNKPLNATGVESPGGVGITASQLSQLQNSGVMAVYVPQQTKIPTILSDVTTWQVDNNVENTSSQQVACRYWLAYSVTSILQQYVGTIATPQSEVVLLNALVACLNALLYAGAGSNGVLASWNKGSLKLTYNGSSQLASISFQAVLVGQNRYITCYASILPLNFSVTATA